MVSKSGFLVVVVVAGSEVAVVVSFAELVIKIVGSGVVSSVVVVKTELWMIVMVGKISDFSVSLDEDKDEEIELCDKIDRDFSPVSVVSIVVIVVVVIVVVVVRGIFVLGGGKVHDDDEEMNEEYSDFVVGIVVVGVMVTADEAVVGPLVVVELTATVTVVVGVV